MNHFIYISQSYVYRRISVTYGWQISRASWPYLDSVTICWIIRRFILWLAPRAGKMTQIARCDWLPERARWNHLARSVLPAVSRKQNYPESHIINPLLTKFARSRWLDIGLVPFFASLWTSTSSRSINTQKKNLANIQPSWPHTWSITHTYKPLHAVYITFSRSGYLAHHLCHLGK